MPLTIHAVFDGRVLTPLETVGLELSKQYLLTVTEEAGATPPHQEQGGEYPLRALLDVAADLGVADLAERHDHYARRR